MRRPFFSIAIPTKNRPDRLRNAVRSVLQQTFPDLEVIVCDNSDESEAPATAAVAREAGDSRVRYVRTNGRLSMPDNWEHAIAHAEGEYVGVLTDRSVYRRDALSLVHTEIQRSGTPVVGWFPDQYGRDPSGRAFKRRPCSGERREIASQELLHYFLNGHPKYGTKLLPKLMTGVCARSVIERVRATPLGRICPPIAPDFTSGYLMLAHTDRVVLLDDSLFVSCGIGNGSSFRRRGPLAERFLRDLGMTWKDCVDRMPTDACFPHAMVLNDLMRIKATLPDVFAGYELNPRHYYVGCLYDHFRSAHHTTNVTEDYDALIEGLNHETEDVQRWVRSRQVYLDALAVMPSEAREFGLDEPEDENEDDEADDFPRFDTIFAALEWGERNPRAPGRNQIIAMPDAESVKTYYVLRHRMTERKV
jgi:glycosyltransferase involved in cell wall biosynthesis